MCTTVMLALMHFEYPGYLVLLATLPLLAALSIRSLAGLGPIRRVVAIVVRCVVVACMVLALAGAQWVRTIDDLTVIFVLDRSSSVPRDLQEEGFEFVQRSCEAMRPAKDRLALIHERLLRNQCRYNMIYSQDRYLDILPYRASKGKAIRYLSYKWEIPLGNFLVCGDSGNDEEMLRGEPLGVVVGNYSPELIKLKGIRGIYFARQKYSGGILEGIKRYQFIEKATQHQGTRDSS